MGLLKEVTDEYIGSLRFLREIPRDLTLPYDWRDVIALIGPRRVGKTFIMLKTASSILERGGQAIYLSFDEPPFRRLEARKLAEMVREEYPRGVVHLFLDEVQEWTEWDSKVRWLHDMGDFRIYVTGSSSVLQSSEIPSRLRGRYISKLLLPLSFREVATAAAKTRIRPADALTFRERGALKSLLGEYMEWGGFPEVWLYMSREKVVSLLETMFYRDIMERHRVRDHLAFMELANLVISNYSNPLTWRSLSRTMRGMGVELDVKTVMNYVEYMRQAFLIFVVRRFTLSAREAAVSPKKVYLVDHGIAKLYERPMDLGRRMENVVLVELVRRGYELGYYITGSGKEVDFVVGRTVVEVCADAGEEHVRKVAEAMRELRAGSGVIVTWDREEELEYGGRTVRIIPLWWWLIGSGPPGPRTAEPGV